MRCIVGQVSRCRMDTCCECVTGRDIMRERGVSMYEREGERGRGQTNIEVDRETNKQTER